MSLVVIVLFWVWAGPVHAQAGPEIHVDAGVSKLTNTDAYSSAAVMSIGGTMWVHDALGLTVFHRRVTYTCTRDVCADVEFAGRSMMLGGRGRVPLVAGAAGWLEAGAVLGRMSQGGLSVNGERLAFELKGGSGLHLAVGAEWRVAERLSIGPWVQYEPYQMPFAEGFPHVVPMKADADATIGRDQRDDLSVRTVQTAAGIRVALRLGGGS